MNISFSELMEYTEWERRKWNECLRRHGDHVLQMSAGPHGDGRFETIGDLVKHIFSAEKRYVQRLTGQPLTDPASIPGGNIAALFEFGEQSRRDLKELLDTFPAKKLNAPQEYHILKYFVKATPKKIVTHILMHEIRHWAQIGTLLRLNGVVDEFHDFLASPVMGGAWEREP